MDCIWANLKIVSQPFLKVTSVYMYINMTFTQMENHSQLLCGHDFTNERLFLCQFDD